MNKTKSQIAIILILMSLVILSCRFTPFGLRAVKTPTPTPVPQPAVQPTLGILISGDTATLTLTEAQVTGYINQYLSDNNQLPIKQPQIHLQNGQMEFNGVLDQGMLSGKIQMTIQISVTPEGGIKFTLVQATLGQYPLPQSLLDSITSQIDQSASQLLNPEQTGYKVETVTITDGTMTITAKRQ